MDQADDPGWPPAIGMLLFLVPGVQLWYLRRQRSADQLVLLRSVFLSFSIALIAFAAVFAVMPDLANGPVVRGFPSSSPSPWRTLSAFIS